MLRTNRRLLLLRHGKAESPLGVADADRPLAARGRAQSGYAGREVRERGLVPDLVVVSPSLRTRQTWTEFAEAAGVYAAGGSPDQSTTSGSSTDSRVEVEVEPAGPEVKVEVEVDVDRRVYANTVDDLLDIVTEAPENVRTLLVVGHNPSIGSLAAVLDDGSSGADRHGLAGGYPTGTLAVFDVAGPWKTVGPGSGRLRAVVRQPS
ncbi:phosphohistidine phosphatase [Actinopolymorpha cephalotaxi]|nr:histidine phosphatase family protein [Actinopolymorpha cephalotaxi]SFG21368.1 phosphohistidine phosphatase [Actinopolymorpha cephalotaxi]